jgi:hypothetical protein
MSTVFEARLSGLPDTANEALAVLLMSVPGATACTVLLPISNNVNNASQTAACAGECNFLLPGKLFLQQSQKSALPARKNASARQRVLRQIVCNRCMTLRS